jgi:hypothetical protein
LPNQGRKSAQILNVCNSWDYFPATLRLKALPHYPGGLQGDFLKTAWLSTVAFYVLDAALTPQCRVWLAIL